MREKEEYFLYESERKTNKEIGELLGGQKTNKEIGELFVPKFKPEIDIDYQAWDIEQALIDAHNYKWANERIERIKSICKTYNVDVPYAMEFLRQQGLKPL